MKNRTSALCSAVYLESGDCFLLLGLSNKIQILPVRDMDRFCGKKNLGTAAQTKALWFLWWKLIPLFGTYWLQERVESVCYLISSYSDSNWFHRFIWLKKELIRCYLSKMCTVPFLQRPVFEFTMALDIPFVGKWKISLGKLHASFSLVGIHFGLFILSAISVLSLQGTVS